MSLKPGGDPSAPSRTAVAIDDVTIRPFDPETDYPPVAELVSRANAVDNLDWIMPEATLRLEVAPHGYFPPAGTQVAEHDGERIGFARTNGRVRGGDKVVHRTEVWTAPEWRRHGIGHRLLAWAEERARAVKAGGTIGQPGWVHEVSITGDDGNPALRPFAAANGYKLIRYSFEMRRRLDDEPIPDAPLPPGLELRPVVPADHRAIWEANTEAFRDHWEATPRTEDDFRTWFADPDHDPTLWQVAWDGDQVAGLSMNTIYAEENARLGINVGWLDQVSVRRPWRRQGIGAAVIAASLRAFKERGLDEASLGVDAENPTGALALYEHLGFTRNRTFLVFRKAI